MQRPEVYLHVLEGRVFLPYNESRFTLPAAYHRTWRAI